MATIWWFSRNCNNQRNDNQNTEDFSRPWPWAYFLNGLNAAASIAPTLIGQRQIEIERERELGRRYVRSRYRAGGVASVLHRSAMSYWASQTPHKWTWRSHTRRVSATALRPPPGDLTPLTIPQHKTTPRYPYISIDWQLSTSTFKIQ